MRTGIEDKALRKTIKRSVKTQKLFERSEFFCVSVVPLFFSLFLHSLDFLFLFYQEKRK
jgi:hypothetical protein